MHLHTASLLHQRRVEKDRRRRLMAKRQFELCKPGIRSKMVQCGARDLTVVVASNERRKRATYGMIQCFNLDFDPLFNFLVRQCIRVLVRKPVHIAHIIIPLVCWVFVLEDELLCEWRHSRKRKGDSDPSYEVVNVCAVREISKSKMEV